LHATAANFLKGKVGKIGLLAGLYSSPWHCEMKWNIATPIDALTAAMIWLHRTYELRSMQSFSEFTSDQQRTAGVDQQ